MAREERFRYTDQELREDIARARDQFSERVRRELPALYRPKLALARDELLGVLERTEDLLRLSPELLITDPTLVAALRYTAGPPISEEDLKTLTGWPFKPRPGSRAVRSAAPALCEVLAGIADPLLFAWVREGRRPSAAERETAVNGTAKLLAVERFRTERRSGASKDQEQLVRHVLARDAGLREVARPERRAAGHISMIDHLERGTFTHECVLHGMKCDVPARLPDGTLMTIECKVSSGQKNGWKRVSREVEGKASRWRERFGSASVAVAIVLDGNFDIGTLTRFQDEGYVIFWTHDLARLASFVAAHGERA